MNFDQASTEGAVVTPYEDGPLIVRGRFVVTTQDGQLIDTGRRTVALCRCGRSAIKPFCDGTHARTGFRAPGYRMRRGFMAEFGDRSGSVTQPVTGVADTAVQPAEQRQPATNGPLGQPRRSKPGKAAREHRDASGAASTELGQGDSDAGHGEK